MNGKLFGREKEPLTPRDHGLGTSVHPGPRSVDPPQDPRVAGAAVRVGGWPFKDKPGLE